MLESGQTSATLDLTDSLWLLLNHVLTYYIILGLSVKRQKVEVMITQNSKTSYRCNLKLYHDCKNNYQSFQLELLRNQVSKLVGRNPPITP